ncbi:hypothetical protein EDB86DRAFT_2990352 [Lactarius hatsudake]|nr:hypothetical protein EDB86DRAFT_2990352 [Lactarius hatsudake]
MTVQGQTYRYRVEVCKREVPWQNCSNSCTTQAQHRCGEHVHRKAYPNPHSGLHRFTSDPRLVVIRSFDMNKPGAESTDDVTGGSDGGPAPRNRDRNSGWHLSRPTDLLADRLGGWRRTGYKSRCPTD